MDLIVANDLENEAKIYSALATLPDNAVCKLQPGELQKYNVIRVGDEILVNLMVSAAGIDYHEAIKDVVVREVDGVPIPFASPRLLWRMKVVTHRENDSDRATFTSSGSGLPSKGKNRRRSDAVHATRSRRGDEAVERGALLRKKAIHAIQAE